jgi:hypothetical protein
MFSFLFQGAKEISEITFMITKLQTTCLYDAINKKSLQKIYEEEKEGRLFDF